MGSILSVQENVLQIVFFVIYLKRSRVVFVWDMYCFNYSTKHVLVL